MGYKKILGTGLAFTGTALVWLPLLAPLLFGLISWAAGGVFRFDYLMPAEFFPFVLIGGGLLLWAAWLAQAHVGLIAGSLAMAIVMIVSSQLVAIVSGLASGDTAAGGWQWTLVLALLALYTLAVAVLALAGFLLLHDLFRPSLPRTE